MPRQRTNTIIRQWQTGTGADHNVLFLHGLGGSPETPLSNGLFRRLDAHGVNATIHGPLLREVEVRDGKIVNESTQTMTEQLRHAREVIENTEGKMVLFGHSFGAKAALKLAREYPEKITGVIVIAPSVKMLYSYWKRITGERGLGDEAQMERVFAQRATALRARLERAEDEEQRVMLEDALKYHTVMTDLLKHNEAALEGPMPVPTLILHGAEDEAVSVHYVRRFAENNRNVTMHTYQGRDHHLMGRTPDDTRATFDDAAERIAGFLAQHGGR